MHRILLFFSIFISCALVSLSGQDLHFTNYTTAPQVLNPAETGNFYGSFRIGATYRDQFSQFFNQGYKTQAIFVETNIAKGFTDYDWISVGLYMNNDYSGDLGFGLTSIGLSGSYHFALDKKYKQIISIGGQFARLTRKPPEGPIQLFDELSNPGMSSSDRNLIAAYTGSTTDINVGVSYKNMLSKKSTWSLGASYYHLTASKITIDSLSLTRDFIPSRINVYTELESWVNKKYSIKPRVYYSAANAASDLAVQLVGKMRTKKADVSMGLGYRIGDAMEFLVGYDIGQWTIRGSFDMTVSSAAAFNNNIGGFELGAIKTFVKHPKAEHKVIQICPRL